MGVGGAGVKEVSDQIRLEDVLIGSCLLLLILGLQI